MSQKTDDTVTKDREFFVDRLYEALESNETSRQLFIQDFCGTTTFKPNTVAKWFVKSENHKYPSMEALRHLIIDHDISVDYLLAGRGSPSLERGVAGPRIQRYMNDDSFREIGDLLMLSTPEELEAAWNAAKVTFGIILQRTIYQTSKTKRRHDDNLLK